MLNGDYVLCTCLLTGRQQPPAYPAPNGRKPFAALQGRQMAVKFLKRQAPWSVNSLNYSAGTLCWAAS